MWITEYLDLPGELLDASLAGDLVVFAGAGVSMGAPAKLPSFWGLTKQIGREASQPLPDESKPLDVYLGHLERNGVPVRDRARAILYRPRGNPTPLHKALINIFAPDTPVRIVTTNFDLLFERAAKRLGQPMEEFDAPALPVGDRFAGIVHLHGSFAKADLRRLVLTDRDFGVAYITEGWAARFLVSVFSKFTVVFVGYSMGDPVMRYLTSALPPGTPRYALIPDNAAPTDWIRGQIPPITYPWTRDHGNLLVSVEAWAAHVQSGFLDHDRQIQRIVETGIPLEPAKHDYLTRMLRQDRTTEFFTRYAKESYWLAWVDDNSLLNPIFNPAATLTEADIRLLYWYTDCFVLTHADAALRILERHDTRMHPVLWRHIANRLCSIEPDTPSRVLSSWLTALEGALSDMRVADALSPLLAARPDQITIQQRLRIFTMLTKPRASLESSVIWKGMEEAESTVRGSADLLGSSHYLGDGWQKLRANIESIADAACVGLVANLRALTQVTLDLDEEQFFDRLSWDRSAIEPHSQDTMGLTETWGILVTAIRDCLDHASSPALARGMIDLLINERGLLAQRLAVHTMAGLPNVSSDEKLAWVLDTVGIYRFGLKHEIFRLLKVVWPDASNVAKNRILSAAYQGTGRGDDTSQYEIYNLLYWLSELIPPHQATLDAFSSFQQLHSTFASRENPDLDHWVSGGFGSYMQTVEARRLPEEPGEVVENLIRLSSHDPDYVELIQLAASRAADDQTWALGLLASMTNEQLWIIELWSAAISGLAINRPNEGTTWATLFSTLAAFPDKSLIAQDVGRLFIGTNREQPESLDEDRLPSALQLIGQYWTAAMNDDTEPSVTTMDWVGQAYATGQGILLLALLTVCAWQWSQAGDSWQGLPGSATELMNRVNAEHGRSGQLARAMLGNQIAFLLAADEAWTRTVALPWFAQAAPPEEAAAAWDGFLVNSQWNERLVSMLGPDFPKLLPLIRVHTPERLRRYIENLALLYIGSNSQIVTPAWLDPFFSSASIADRVTWTDSVFRRIPRQPSELGELWNTRLAPLLKRRLDRIPLPLAPEELSILGGWVARADAIADPLLDSLISSGKPVTDDNLLIRDVAENSTLDVSATAGARLLTWLVSGIERGTWFCSELATTAIRLHEAGAAESELLRLCEQLARIGCPQARALGERFK